MVKSSVDLLLWTHNKSSASTGHHPIYIRINVNGVRSYYSTGHVVSSDQWDDKHKLIINHLSSHEMNVSISISLSKIQKLVNKLQMEGETFTAASIKASLSAKDLHNVFNFVDQMILEVKGKRADSTIMRYPIYANKLEKFHGSRNLCFEDIDVDFLVKYEQWLRLSVGNNYTHKLLTVLRSFFNAAIKRDLITNYPFKQYDFPSYSSPTKAYLSMEEINRWEAFADRAYAGDIRNKSVAQSAMYFLLGCYTGLRVSDWKQFNIEEHVKNNQLLLKAKKNGEWVSIPITKRLHRAINRIKKYPLTIEEPTINEKLKEIAKDEDVKIKKHITTHTGRHTFAVTMCAEKGISSETCATLMGITIKTCVENYYRVNQKKIENELNGAWGE